MSSPNYEYYGLMATFWDLFRGDTSNWEDRFFYLEVIKKYGQPVLDVGCGTGRLLIDFLQQGIDIDGVDNSPEMLALCQDKAKNLGLNANLFQQEMQVLSLPRKYQTILVPSSSFQLLLDASLASVAMQRFYEHLIPSGILVMPFMTLWQAGEPLESSDLREVFRPEDGALIRRQSHTRFDPSTSLEHTVDRYEIIKENQIVKSEEHIQSPATRSYTQAQAHALFEQAGFQDIKIFSQFTFEPVQPNDTLFSLIGTKP